MTTSSQVQQTCKAINAQAAAAITSVHQSRELLCPDGDCSHVPACNFGVSRKPAAKYAPCADASRGKHSPLYSRGESAGGCICSATASTDIVRRRGRRWLCSSLLHRRPSRRTGRKAMCMRPISCLVGTDDRSSNLICFNRTCSLCASCCAPLTASLRCSISPRLPSQAVLSVRIGHHAESYQYVRQLYTFPSGHHRRDAEANKLALVQRVWQILAASSALAQGRS